MASRDIDDAYDIGAVLGRGAYSVVKTAKSKKTSDEVIYSIGDAVTTTLTAAGWLEWMVDDREETGS